jgi:hypothetical protein
VEIPSSEYADIFLLNEESFFVKMKQAAATADPQTNPKAVDNSIGFKPKGSWYHLVNGGYAFRI